MNPRVRAVSTSDNYQLHLTFTNGEHGSYSCVDILEHGVFKELQDVHYFKQVKVVDGTIAWPHEQDICPDTLYTDAIKDP